MQKETFKIPIDLCYNFNIKQCEIEVEIETSKDLNYYKYIFEKLIRKSNDTFQKIINSGDFQNEIVNCVGNNDEFDIPSCEQIDHFDFQNDIKHYVHIHYNTCNGYSDTSVLLCEEKFKNIKNKMFQDNSPFMQLIYSYNIPNPDPNIKFFFGIFPSNINNLVVYFHVKVEYVNYNNSYIERQINTQNTLENKYQKEFIHWYNNIQRNFYKDGLSSLDNNKYVKTYLENTTNNEEIEKMFIPPININKTVIKYFVNKNKLANFTYDVGISFLENGTGTKKIVFNYNENCVIYKNWIKITNENNLFLTKRLENKRRDKKKQNMKHNINFLTYRIPPVVITAIGYTLAFVGIILNPMEYSIVVANIFVCVNIMSLIFDLCTTEILVDGKILFDYTYLNDNLIYFNIFNIKYDILHTSDRNKYDYDPDFKLHISESVCNNQLLSMLLFVVYWCGFTNKCYQPKNNIKYDSDYLSTERALFNIKKYNFELYEEEVPTRYI